MGIFAGVKRNASATERASAAAPSSIAYRIGCGDGDSNLTARDGMLSSTGHGFAKLTTYEPFKKYVSWVLVLFTGPLEFNEQPSIGFYTSDVRKHFESKFARIFRGRVIISRDNLRSQPAPATSRVVAAGSVLQFAEYALSFCRSATKAGSLVTAARDILGVAAAIDVNALGRQFQHPIGQCCQKVPVVRDEQHGALILR